MSIEWHSATVRRIVQRSHNTRSFFLEMPAAAGFHFKPGQFLTLDLPIHEQRNRRWRSYSIASAPEGTGEVELLIVYLPGGKGTEYLFHQVEEGSTIMARGPHGLFLLPQDYAARPLYLVSTGTGIAPFRSMVRFLAASAVAPSAAITMVAGYRSAKDLLYHDELRELAAACPWFKYHPTLSREQWDGHCGYVHAVYQALCHGQQDARFMLCGWRAMVDEAKERLFTLGYDKASVLYELYG